MPGSAENEGGSDPHADVDQTFGPVTEDLPDFMRPRFKDVPLRGPGSPSPDRPLSGTGLSWSLRKEPDSPVQPPAEPARRGIPLIGRALDHLRRRGKSEPPPEERPVIESGPKPLDALVEVLRDPVRREAGLANLRRMRGEEPKVTSTPEQLEKMKEEILSDNNKRLTRFLFEFQRYSQQHADSNNRFNEWLSEAHSEGRWEEIYNVSQVADMLLEFRSPVTLLEGEGLTVRNIFPEEDFDDLINELWRKINYQDEEPTPLVADAEQLQRLGFDPHGRPYVEFEVSDSERSGFKEVIELIERLVQEDAEKAKTPEEIEAIRDRIRDEYNAEAARRIEAVIAATETSSSSDVDKWEWLKKAKIPGEYGQEVDSFADLYVLLHDGNITRDQIQRLTEGLKSPWATEDLADALLTLFARNSFIYQPTEIDPAKFIPVDMIRTLRVTPQNIQQSIPLDNYLYKLPPDYQGITISNENDQDKNRILEVLDYLVKLRGRGATSIFDELFEYHERLDFSRSGKSGTLAELNKVAGRFQEFRKENPGFDERFNKDGRSPYQEFLRQEFAAAYPEPNQQDLLDGHINSLLGSDVMHHFPTLLIQANLDQEGLEKAIDQLSFIFNYEECRMILDNYFRMRGVSDST
jgi:hypothetical protein